MHYNLSLSLPSSLCLALSPLQTMLISPLADRNQKELCSVLCDVLEEQSHRELFALELGSGTGQHVVNFAMAMPFITWQLSDIKEESRDRWALLGPNTVYIWS